MIETIFWTESWKPTILTQSDAQPRGMERLIVLLFVREPWIVLIICFH